MSSEKFNNVTRILLIKSIVFLGFLFFLTIPCYAQDYVPQEDQCDKSDWNYCKNDAQCVIVAVGCAGPNAVNIEYEKEVKSCLMDLTAERDCEYNLESKFKNGFSAVCVKNQCKILIVNNNAIK